MSLLLDFCLKEFLRGRLLFAGTLDLDPKHMFIAIQDAAWKC